MVTCTNSDGYKASLIAHKTYLTLPDPDAERHGLIRVIDETDEDYLYPASHFVPTESAQEPAGRFHAAACQYPISKSVDGRHKEMERRTSSYRSGYATHPGYVLNDDHF